MPDVRPRLRRAREREVGDGGQSPDSFRGFLVSATAKRRNGASSLPGMLVAVRRAQAVDTPSARVRAANTGLLIR
jgi:hypothetical protein